MIHKAFKAVLILILLLIFIIAAIYLIYFSDLSAKLKTEKIKVNGVYVDYDCRPIRNMEITARSTLRRHTYFSSGTHEVNHALTDDEGIFEVDVYLGNSAIIYAGESWKYDAPYLQYDKAALQQLNSQTSKDHLVILYVTPQFNDYQLTSYRKWLKKPSFFRASAPDRLIVEEGKVFIDNEFPFTVSIKSAGNHVDDGWIIYIDGQPDGGISMPSNNGTKPDGRIPKTGYKKRIEIFLPNVGHPYETKSAWHHNVFYLKADKGSTYGIMSLDIGLISPFDEDNYKTLKPGAINQGGNRAPLYLSDKTLAIWAKIDLIRSSKSVTENVSDIPQYYRARTTLLPIANPFIPQKNCGGILQDTYDGYFGRHPPPSDYYLRERSGIIKSEKSRKEMSQVREESKKKFLNDFSVTWNEASLFIKERFSDKPPQKVTLDALMDGEPRKHSKSSYKIVNIDAETGDIKVKYVSIVDSRLFGGEIESEVGHFSVSTK